MEAWELGLAKGGKTWGGQMHTASLPTHLEKYILRNTFEVYFEKSSKKIQKKI